MAACTLYHCAGARSLRVLWALREAGARPGRDYRLVVLPFPPRAFRPSFRAINPLMTVPYVVFDDDANPPLDGLSESVAAAQAAVERFAAPAVRAALTVPEGDAAGGGERRAYLNWLAMADATLTFPLAVCNRYRFVQPGRSDEASADYEAFFLGRMRRLEATLSDGRAFLVGGRFTLADLCVGYSLHLAHQLGIGEKLPPRCEAWYQTLLQRPALREALQEEEEAEALPHEERPSRGRAKSKL